METESVTAVVGFGGAVERGLRLPVRELRRH